VAVSQQHREIARGRVIVPVGREGLVVRASQVQVAVAIEVSRHYTGYTAST
jgi:hypothetical protein